MKVNEISLFLLRLSISYIWITAGISKLFNNSFIPTFSSTMQNFIKACHYDFYVGFLKQYIVPNVHIFAQLTIWGEILVGVGFLLGFPIGLATFFGIFMNANYFLVSAAPPSQFLNILMIFSQLAVSACNAGNIWGLSAKIGKK